MFNFIAKPLLVPERFYSLFDVLLIAVFIMFILLKIISLRRSWINDQKVWFWVLIFVNTLGILEMVYLLTNKENPKPRTPKEKKVKIKEPKIEGIETNEPAMAVSDIDNIDLAQEEVIESFNEIASENEVSELVNPIEEPKTPENQ